MKSDLQIRHDVEEELEWEPGVAASSIDVEVKEGVVTLKGHLASFGEKVAAEQAAQRVGGVRALLAELTVRLPQEEVRGDGEIANFAHSMLRWTTGVSEGSVRVLVEHGHVVLRGTVDYAWQSRAAARAIAQLRGVTSVANEIEVKHLAEPAKISKDILDAMHRHAEREARHIRVSVREGTVTLSGTVHSYAERAVARGAAWAAPGVGAVVDDLNVE
ncbi:osmotically-inducible protein OsmY [Paraburkholderia bannensis]|uniref:Osmotically-inducible protein OsmY n=1 Tax=Paraburkholderia bannensis TaxID=765414 RepID=A0A7W9TXV7_9BURK|nr:MULTISPECIES: BON domain-containing protein [Paraburkholderia]MBB3258121.1 osmotically-inducible protein OsmY [Paraburkholderia sp. WP4_3_2]MBB6103134.1 osmotically-inducible protein OsmY [Paraburkholderia bannensis]